MRHPTHLHSGGFDWAKARLVVFSQDDAFRFLVRQTFRKLNIREVLSTSVPADATQFMGQAPDAALVDMDGDAAQALAFLERVRAVDPTLPVLAVARPDNKPQVMRAVPLGIEGFLPKPISGHELSHRVAEAIKTPRRIPVPAAKPKAEVTLQQRPAEAAAPPTAQAAAQKAELAALAARLGQAVSGGAGGGGNIGANVGGGRGSGGTLGGGDPAPAKKAGGGTYGDDGGGAAGASGGKIGGGTLDFGDMPGAPKGGGLLGDDDFPDAAGGKKKKKKSPLEALAEALPEALRPKRRDGDDEEEAERQRRQWQDELAAAGHEERTGKDVAGLNVEAIVAGHVQWLTTQGAQGKRAEFKGMDLAGGDFASAVLANAGFRDADLSDANLAEARLDGADFRYASLSAADLNGANLGVAQLRHSDLRLANLQGASLRGADLSGAKLRGAKLAGADFKGATLVGTDLKDADLSQADNLSQGQVDKAECDMKTKLPPGLRRPRKDEDQAG